MHSCFCTWAVQSENESPFLMRVTDCVLTKRGSRDTVVACGAWVVTSVDSGVKP